MENNSPEKKSNETDFKNRVTEGLISVVLAAYNGEKYLPEQLQSILNQSYANIELICIDDCSGDSTIDILKRFRKEHPDLISIYLNDKNLGPRNSFEKGCRLARGEYMAFSDQDDWWAPDKLEKLHKIISNNGRLAFVYSNAELVDKNLQTLKKRIWKSHEVLRGDDFYDVVHENVVMGCTILAKTSFIREVMPFPPEGMYHDYYLAVMAKARNYRIDFVDEPLIKYRQHELNVIGRDKNYRKKRTYRDKTLGRYYEVSLLDFDKILDKKLYEVLKLKQMMLEGIIKRNPIKAFKYHKAYYKAMRPLGRDRKDLKWRDFRMILRSPFIKWPRI